MKYTPEIITSLKDNEIFVFGSNEAGIHGAGAALNALHNFGAKPYGGYGIMGQSFAIPTKDYNIKTLPLSKIEMYIDKFIQYVLNNKQYTFYLTKIGCGLAGYKPHEIKEILWNVINKRSPFSFPNNLIIPVEFMDN